jgi:uncharacterized LabA/DUF88 family protein
VMAENSAGLIRTNVYVDGFNLFYGCVKGTPCRWLNLAQFCQKLFPQNSITRIRYFTALVNSPPYDPAKQQRQQAYLRALRTIPHLSIHLGQFRTNQVVRDLVSPPLGGPRQARVLDPKEKGSDVALATHLLVDGFRGEYDAAVVVSNDSDLCLPIEKVRTELGLAVIVVSPTSLPGRRPSYELRQVATFFMTVREASLRACQFPETLWDEAGVFTKPAKW